MDGSLNSVAGLRKSVDELPRFQKDLNVAERKTVASLDALLREIESGKNLATTVQDSMESILRELSCPEATPAAS
jgi:hypothetical protein